MPIPIVWKMPNLTDNIGPPINIVQIYKSVLLTLNTYIYVFTDVKTASTLQMYKHCMVNGEANTIMTTCSTIAHVMTSVMN